MLKNQKIEFGIASLVSLLFGSILIVGAAVINAANESVFINETINPTLNTTIYIGNQSANNKFKLAKLLKEDDLDFDRKSRLEYLEKNGNFSKIEFKKINGKGEFKLKSGAKRDNLRGVLIDNGNFAIDLLYCEASEKYCTFRINGIPIARIHDTEESEKNKQNSFALDKNHVLKVNSIKFNQCDNKRFCHLGYEGYDVVNVSIEINDK